MTRIKVITGLLALAVSQWVTALPLTANDTSGFRGQVVGVTLTEGPTAPLLNLQTYVTFTPGHLSFESVLMGHALATPDDRFLFVDDSVAGVLSVGIFGGLLSLREHDAGTLLTVNFRILDGAPASTLVKFECFGTAPSVDCIDGEFDPLPLADRTDPNDPSGVVRSASITVLPLPGTVWLLGLGLAALAVTRNRVVR